MSKIEGLQQELQEQQHSYQALAAVNQQLVQQVREGLAKGMSDALPLTVGRVNFHKTFRVLQVQGLGS